MKLYTWLIPEDYKSDKHIGEGEYEGDCVYVLAHDIKEKIIFCYTGHAFSYTNKITLGFPAIVESNDSVYYDEILHEMVEVPKSYSKPDRTKQKYQHDFIEYLFTGIRTKRPE